jgi:hypothetical protein
MADMSVKVPAGAYEIARKIKARHGWSISKIISGSLVNFNDLGELNQLKAVTKSQRIASERTAKV